MDGKKTSGKKTLGGFSPQAERKFSAKRPPRKKPPEAPSMVLVDEVLEAPVGEPKASCSSSGAPKLKKQFYKKLSPEDKSMYIGLSILVCFLKIKSTGCL